MDKFLMNFLVGMTVAIPAVIGIARYTAISKEYKAFIWICCAVTINEVLMFILIKLHIYTFMSYNLTVLIICFLYLWMFKSWGLFDGRKNWLIGLCISLLAVWIADHFVIHGYMLAARTHYFRVCFSLTLVLLSVNTINRLIVSEKRNLLQNSRFLICICLVVYYTYRILVDAFSLKGMSQPFLLRLADFNRYLVISLNLIFAIAALWIPRKKNFTLQF